MNETVTLTANDQMRIRTLNRFIEGSLTGQEAADQLDVCLRQLRRLAARYRMEGVAAIPHRNRGRSPGHATPKNVRNQVVELSRTTYTGVNDSQVRDLFAERDGIDLSVSTVRRIRREAEESSPRQRRPAKHRQRRERRVQEGMLIQIESLSLNPAFCICEAGRSHRGLPCASCKLTLTSR